MTSQELIQKYKLKISSVFVPYSQSRNANVWESLNWRVTLSASERDIITFDYSAGIAYCPSASWERNNLRKRAIELEIETGRPTRKGYGDMLFTTGKPVIQPDMESVIYNLVIESSILDYTGFVSWADEYGYDSDSIKAKSVYDSCLETALVLRGCLGQQFLDDAQLAFEDF